MTYQISPGELSYLAVSAFGALQKPAEFQSLLERVAELKPRTILEIGVGNGGTSWALSKLQGLETLIAIDMPGGNWGGNSAEKTGEAFGYIKQGTTANVHLILGNSQNSGCLDPISNILAKATIGTPSSEVIDLLFIDGDHSYNGVKTDFLIYSPLVRKGGLIAFHDICEHPPETGCEVKKWWDELKAGTAGFVKHEFIEEPKTWGGIGVIEW